MNITCSNIDDLLLEGDSYSMQLAAQHARDCASCREKLDDWNDIGETAQSLRAEWPSDMLWPRINRAIRAERRHHLIGTTWRIAAGLVLTVGLAAGGWMATQHSKNVAFERSILTANALDEVERAEQAHVTAINHLEKVADAKLDDPKSPLIVAYKEKLMMLDDAIAECQSNIDSNRQNANLRKQLLAIYSEKQRTLEAVMREGNHVANQ